MCACEAVALNFSSRHSYPFIPFIIVEMFIVDFYIDSATLLHSLLLLDQHIQCGGDDDTSAARRHFFSAEGKAVKIKEIKKNMKMQREDSCFKYAKWHVSFLMKP